MINLRFLVGFLLIIISFGCAGWYIGYLETKDNTIFFALNLDGETMRRFGTSE